MLSSQLGRAVCLWGGTFTPSLCHHQSDWIVSDWGIRQDRILYPLSLLINTVPHTHATRIHRASAARGERGSERKNTVEHLPKTPKGLDCSLLIPRSQHVPTLKYLSAELVFGLIRVLRVSAFVPPIRMQKDYPCIWTAYRGLQVTKTTAKKHVTSK